MPFICTWSGGFRGELVQYVTCHLDIVPGDAERSDYGILRETERRQPRDMLDIDVLVRRRLWLGHRSTAATATRIISRPHQRRETCSVRFQVDVLHDMLTRAADHDRVFIMMVLTGTTLLASLRRPWS